MEETLLDETSVREMLGQYVSPRMVEECSRESFCFGCERREVTVLFADIRNFTAMSEKMEPMAVGHLLNEHFTEMSEIVFGHEGMLDKFIGDGMMVLFGAPLSRPGDTDRAVACALRMQERFAELKERWKEGFPQTQGIGLGIGIHRGQAVVGNFGSKKRLFYTAIGDTVNFASRLESVARAGQVIVSGDVISHLKAEVEAKKLRPRKIKGKEGKHTLFAII